MSWARKPHPVEVAIEWLAPVPLALAVGWASWRIGLSSIESVGLAGCALAAGHLAFKLGSGNRLAPLQGFQPAEFASIEPDELVLSETDAVLELNDRLLTVTVERKEKTGESESSYNSVRSISVPDSVKSDAILAKLEDGILTVTLPKSEERKPRHIEVA